MRMRGATMKNRPPAPSRAQGVLHPMKTLPPANRRDRLRVQRDRLRVQTNLLPQEPPPARKVPPPTNHRPVKKVHRRKILPPAKRVPHLMNHRPVKRVHRRKILPPAKARSARSSLRLSSMKRKGHAAQRQTLLQGLNERERNAEHSSPSMSAPTIPGR